MVDIKQEIKDKVKPDPTDLLLAEAEVREKDPKQPHRKLTRGEVAFDRIVYTGIGFGVNEASSLWITDQFVHGKPRWFLGGKWFSHEGFELLGEKMAKAFKWTPDKAKNSLLMAVLLTGGTLLMWPMKKLEDDKGYWVKKANHFIDGMRGNKMSAEEVAARDDEVEKAIACEPKQTWPSILLGRAAAMFASWSTGTFAVGKKNNDSIKNFSEKLITGSVQPNGTKNVLHRYAALTGVETYSCLISSIVMEMASKLFAKHGQEVHDPELCTAVVHDTANSAPVSGSSDQTASTDSKQVTPVVEEDKLSQYKKKTILATESHTDRVERASEPHYSMAP